jgi:hypothetical protein
VHLWVPASDLNVRATALNWLVLAPDGKLAVRGTYRTAQGSDAGFVLYGYEGCKPLQRHGCQPGPNRLRLVTWDLSRSATPEGSPPLYDSQPGAPFDLDVADPRAVAGFVDAIYSPLGAAQSQ